MTLASQSLMRPPVPEWHQYLVRRLGWETPHVDDRFFAPGEPRTPVVDGTNFAPTGSISFLEGGNVLAALATANESGDLAGRLWPFTVATAPLTVEIAWADMIPAQNFSMGGLVLSDGTTTTSNAISFTSYTGQQDLRSGTLNNMSGSTTIGNLIATGARHHNYMRLIWKSTNSFQVQRSSDGINWAQHTSAVSVTLAPTHYGVVLSTYNAGGLRAEGNFAYIRVSATDPTA